MNCDLSSTLSLLSHPLCPLSLPEIAFEVSRDPDTAQASTLVQRLCAQSCVWAERICWKAPTAALNVPADSQNAASLIILLSPTCALFLVLSFSGFSFQPLVLVYSSLYQTENLFITCWFLPRRCLRAVIESSILFVMN